MDKKSGYHRIFGRIELMKSFQLLIYYHLLHLGYYVKGFSLNITVYVCMYVCVAGIYKSFINHSKNYSSKCHSWYTVLLRNTLLLKLLTAPGVPLSVRVPKTISDKKAFYVLELSKMNFVTFLKKHFRAHFEKPPLMNKKFETTICMKITVRGDYQYLKTIGAHLCWLPMQFSEICKVRWRVTNLALNSLENFTRMIENDSLQTAAIAKSKWQGQKHILGFLYKKARALWRWRWVYKAFNF